MTSLKNKPSDTSRKLFLQQLNYHSTPNPISFDEYVALQRSQILIGQESKRIIYYDTLAWKCISDFLRGKTNLTQEMAQFAKIATDKKLLDRCIFPIGFSTLCELQSMNDPLTISTLSKLVDEYSKNICVVHEREIINTEFDLFASSADEPNPRTLFFCRSFEMFGIPELPDKAYELTNIFSIEAFNKASYDILSQLPISAQLEIGLKQSKWSNSENIAELNEGKTSHQEIITNFKTGVLFELAGVLSLILENEPLTNGITPSKRFAMEVMLYWHQNPKSKHLSTARVIANLHGLMRFRRNRPFKLGDIADFSAATCAIPVCDAFFTDRRLANILTDPLIEISKFSNCEIISGFENFASYLQKVVQQ